MASADSRAYIYYNVFQHDYLIHPQLYNRGMKHLIIPQHTTRMFVGTDFETMSRNTCKFHIVPITSVGTVQSYRFCVDKSNTGF